MAIVWPAAPAAFGFSLYLNQCGEKPREVRRQLLVFSLAAPVSLFHVLLVLHVQLGRWSDGGGFFIVLLCC
jgi:hypothetical protein